MDRRNIAITNKMTEILNNVKGFEAAMSNPKQGKMLVRHNGVTFYVTVEPVFNDNVILIHWAADNCRPSVYYERSNT